MRETKIQTQMIEARRSGFYDVSADCELEWAIPKNEHTFKGVEDNFSERPTYVRCSNCSKVIKYGAGAWETFSMEHGEMCRVRKSGV